MALLALGRRKASPYFAGFPCQKQNGFFKGPSFFTTDQSFLKAFSIAVISWKGLYSYFYYGDVNRLTTVYDPVKERSV